MNRAMLDATNAQNLADVLRDVPFLNRYITDNKLVGYAGVLDMQYLAVYKNGFPLLMDQNVAYDVRSIPLWDVDSIAIYLSELNNWGKNKGGVSLHLYSKGYIQKPSQFSASISPSSMGDINTYLHADFSNAKHSVSVGTNRSFEAQMPADSRYTPWGVSQRYDANLRYKYYILPSVTLDLNIDNSWLSRVIKSDIIPRTTRVKDIEERFRRHHIFGSLTTAVSKNHNLILNGQYHQIYSFQQSMDKDLSSQKQEFGKVSAHLDELGYRQGWMQLYLDGKFEQYGYQAGLDISATADRVFPTINAIRSSYSDYGVFGLFYYQYKDIGRLQAGAKMLTNSLTGTYFLPQAKLSLTSDDVIKVSLAYNRSVAYPSFSQVFYGIGLTLAEQNNLLLQPVLLNYVHSELQISKNAFEMQTGLMFNQQNNIISVKGNAFVNSGKSSGTYTYFNVKYTIKESYIKPCLVLHGINPYRDSLNRVFFYPEFNLHANWYWTKLNTSLLMASRFIGKYTSSNVTGNTNEILETGDFTMLDLAVRRSFFKDRLLTSLGVNNVLNTQFINQNTYRFVQFDRELVNQNRVIEERGRYFFTKLTFTIN
ncbi:MAG: hypothetical protein RLZZ337_805 [Bacteroidota bacterium]|jgi:hypothetical protein